MTKRRVELVSLLDSGLSMCKIPYFLVATTLEPPRSFWTTSRLCCTELTKRMERTNTINERKLNIRNNFLPAYIG